jgi:hypothetical protein
MIKQFITWLYYRFVLTPLAKKHAIKRQVHQFVKDQANTEIAAQRAMYEKEVLSRVCRTDH